MFDLTPFRRRGNMFPFIDEIEKNFMQNLGERFSAFKTDIVDKGDSFMLEAELPGFSRENINIHVDDNRLTISAEHNVSEEESKDNFIRRERRHGSFTRSFDVSDIKTEEIKANYEDGVLTLELPKKEGDSSSIRRIDIN